MDVDFASCLVFNTRLAARAVIRHGDDMLRPYGVTSAQFQLLGGLRRAGPEGRNVTELAALCGISTRHLRRLFKQTTKQTLHEYVRDAWVAKAKSLLCDTELPLKEITSRIGFTDPSSFSMAFRRATGAAPRTFRQQFAKGGFVARLEASSDKRR